LIDAGTFIYSISESDGVIVFALIPVFDSNRLNQAYYYLMVAV
jgi:hypothetical protein